MAPKKRGGPAQPVNANYSTHYYAGGSPASESTGTDWEVREVPVELSVFEVEASADIDSPAAQGFSQIIDETPASRPDESVPVDAVADAAPTAIVSLAIASPGIISPAITSQGIMENADSGAGNAALAPMGEAASASASLIGSVVGSIGLASIIGGGLVVVGLGAAIGAWYSVSLANNYVTRRWGTGRSGAA
jgi:hypothetical protein